jgi:glyoxalase/bleomycin resistance protein/dioxygenase superfamily protein
MFLRGHYQNAYVTHDLDAAMDLLTKRYGLKDYIVFEPDMILKTPQGDKASSVRAALAWDGGLNIELIQPVSGHLDHYLPFLPKDKNDPTPRFHHVAVRRDDEQAMREEIDRLGLPLAFEGQVPGLIFIYLDARESLGHYFEYIWATPEMWTATGWPEGLKLL